VGGVFSKNDGCVREKEKRKNQKNPGKGKEGGGHPTVEHKAINY